MLRRSIPDIILWTIGRRRRFIVQGQSMSPTLRDGDWILVEDGYYVSNEPVCGDLVLIEHPNHPQLVMVKRISNIDEDQIFLLGDNPLHSTDSRHFGSVHRENLIARVWARI